MKYDPKMFSVSVTDKYPSGLQRHYIQLYVSYHDKNHLLFSTFIYLLPFLYQITITMESVSSKHTHKNTNMQMCKLKWLYISISYTAKHERSVVLKMTIIGNWTVLD